MKRSAWILVALIAMLWPAADALHAQTSEGARLFESHCAMCHGNPESTVTAPAVLSLWKMTPEAIYAGLAKAPHTALQGISDADKRTIAFFLGGRKVGVDRYTSASLMPNKCSANPPLGYIALKPSWIGGWASL